jgi:hypothetical protein
MSKEQPMRDPMYLLLVVLLILVILRVLGVI